MKRAIERLIEIVGEAAWHVSRECKDTHPEIPWQGIIGQRHVLAHEYGDIKYDRLWRIAAIRTKELIALLTPLIPILPPSVEL